MAKRPDDNEYLSPLIKKGAALMSDLFENYEEEYRGLAADIQKKLSDVTTYETNADKRKQTLKQVQGQVTQVETLLKQMDVEIRSQSDPGTKAALTTKVQTIKKSFQTIRNDYQRANEREEQRALIGSPDRGLSLEQRQRLLNTTDKLAKQNDTISNARRVMAETEGVALEIGEELSRNREKISGIHDKVREVGGMTNTARRLIHSMSKREMQHKLLLYGVAAILLLAIILIIYYSSRR